MGKYTIKTALRAVFLIGCLLCGIHSFAAKKSNEIDFAYPKTVAKISEEQLDKNLKSHNYTEVLRNLLNLVVAENLVSDDKTINMLPRIDSIAGMLPPPFSSIACLIEAEIYTEIYESIRYQANNRILAETDNRLNPKFWDATQFSNKVTGLLIQALSNEDIAVATPLSEIKNLITDVKGIDSFSVYDFIVYNAIKSHSLLPETDFTIPFYQNRNRSFPSEAELIDRLISIHTDLTEARICAISKKISLLDKDSAEKFLWDEIQTNSSTRPVIPLVLIYYRHFIKNNDDIMPLNSAGEKKIPSRSYFYSFINQLREKFKGSSELDNIYSQLIHPQINLSSPSSVIPQTDFQVVVKTENIKEFYLLLIDAESTGEDYISSKLLKNKNILSYEKISTGQELPFSGQDTVMMSVPRAGKYVIIASSSKSVDNILLLSQKDIRVPVFTASDIDIITLNPTASSLSDEMGCYVVKARNSNPAENAEVEVKTNRGYRKAPLVNRYRTDASGFAAIREPGEVKASYNGSVTQTSIYRFERNHTPAYNIRMFSSQAVYRPGDTIEFFGIIYVEDTNHGNILSSKPVDIAFLDVNRQKIDSVKTVSDSSGRIFGSFKVPKEGLLGTWRISAEFTDERNCNRSFTLPIQIEEYKVPPFIISLERETSPSDSIKFSGRALTYAGMPVTFASVDYTIHYQPNYTYRWRGFTPQSFTAATQTNGEGNFYISLPMENINPEQYRGVFTLSASVAENNGETVNSSPLLFWLHPDFTLYASVPDIIGITDEGMVLNIKVNDAIGLPVKKTVEYEVENISGKKIQEGEFESPVFNLETKNMPSGEYVFKFRIKDYDNSDWTVYNSILYRPDDKTPPIETALWVPEKKYIADLTEKEVKIHYGCSYPGQYILCLVSNSSGHVEKRWLVSNGNNEVLKVSVPAPDQRTYVRLITYRNHNPKDETITIIPFEQTKKFEIVTESFRSNISAGEKEHWKFKILYDGKPVDAYAYAVLYDKAMDAICPLSWNSRLFYPVYPDPINCNTKWNSLWNISYSPSKYVNAGDQALPVFRFNTYGYPLYSHARIQNLAMQKSRSIKTSANAEAMEYPAYDNAVTLGVAGVTEDAAEYGAITEGNDENAISTSGSGIEFRPIEMPVALFMPDLCNKAGDSLDINFTVPNFNTTWKLIIGAYTADLKSSISELETIASKRVMIKMNAPRFVRTGDDIILKATLYNNTPEIIMAAGEYEIFNPDTGDILASSTADNIKIDPSGNIIISTSFICPSNLSAIGLRVYGKTSNSSDGEETIIPVLPSSQPVVESLPFFLKPGTDQYEFNLPSFPENASVTFTYCDNPVWEAVTSLSPIIKTESESVLALMNALYANCVGSGLMEQNPNLRRGLELIVSGEAGDSLLVSNLQKNNNLKIVSLNNTPWVNNAVSENLRLSRLSSLLNKESADTETAMLWQKISNLQNPDGGWSWCPQMKSSEWITYNVLYNFGNLKKQNYLPETLSVSPAIKSAIKYCDNEIVKRYSETGKKYKEEYLKGIWYYLYIRSFYPEVAKAPNYSSISGTAINLIEKDWKKFDIFDKATVATLLWREGKKKTSLEILESIREYATITDSGIYFDNQGTSVLRANKLATTSQVITAFNEILPNDPIIDGLRQWLLLQKQTQDWTERSADIFIINALLTAGTSWDGEYRLPEIEIAGRKIDTGEFERLTGSCKVNINLAETADGKVVISRTAPTQAWGAVISQYVAPMDSVKEFATEELSVSKEYLRLEEKNGKIVAVPANIFNVGDRVRINIIIDCGKETDFIVVNDERAACMEPLAQISGYTALDGILCYRELKNNVTNIFIPTLSKGKHVLSYDCSINEEGTFSSGIITVQSLYAPSFTSHSAGSILRVIN